MTPFFNGMAIGLAVGILIFAAYVALAVIIWAIRFCWILFRVAGHDVARKWREDRGGFAAARIANGKLLTPSQALRACLIRTGRILCHPIRERAFIAESFRALRDPKQHRWSDGLS